VPHCVRSNRSGQLGMIKSKRKYFVTGAKAIGDELGCSPITVPRMIKSKLLKAFRTGDNRSPWKVWLAEIERIRGCIKQMEPAECDTIHADMVQTFRLLRHPSHPDLTILRIETQDGKVLNFRVEREAFAHVVSVWNFDLGAIARAIESGGPLPGKPFGSADRKAT
jgi:hypothetical protein